MVERDFLSGNVEVREAKLEDAAGIARVRAESWRAAYRGIVPGEFLEAIDVAEWAERQRHNMENEPAGLVAFVATIQDEVVGWAACGRNREKDTPYAGELFTVYLLPDHWRRGIGRLLMKAAAQSLIERGMDSMILWVLGRELAGTTFLRSVGGQYVSQRGIEIGGACLREVSYVWDDLSPLVSPS